MRQRDEGCELEKKATGRMVMGSPFVSVFQMEALMLCRCGESLLMPDKAGL